MINGRHGILVTICGANAKGDEGRNLQTLADVADHSAKLEHPARKYKKGSLHLTDLAAVYAAKYPGTSTSKRPFAFGSA